MADLATELMLIPIYTRISIFWLTLTILALLYTFSLSWEEIDEDGEDKKDLHPAILTCKIGASGMLGISLIHFIASLIIQPDPVIDTKALGILFFVHIGIAGKVWLQIRSHRVTKKI